jgi:hypothetical protein
MQCELKRIEGIGNPGKRVAPPGKNGLTQRHAAFADRTE